MKSSELKGYITGLLLGDGYIDKGVTRRGFRLKSINKDFIEQVYQDLSDVTNFKLRIDYYESSKRDGVKRKGYDELVIKATPYFSKKYHFFYDDKRRRRVVNESLRWLNDRGVANWFMCDGYVVLVGKTKGEITHRRVELSTDRYSEKDVDKIVEYFKKEYDLSVTKVKRKEGVYRVRFHLQTVDKLFVRIAPYMVESMKYKLNLAYGYQPSWMSDEYFHLMNEITECENPYK